MSRRLTFRTISATAPLFALLLLGCGSGGGGGGGGGGGPPDPLVLFEETFSTPSGAPSVLTDQWSVTVGAGCSATNTDADVLGSPPQGIPTPGLVFRCPADPTLTAASTLHSHDTFVLNIPMTFFADARVDSVRTTGALPPGMKFALESLNTGAPFAGVILRTDFAVLWMKSGASEVQVSRTYPADGLFHRFEFSVDGAGGAEWRRDGVLEAATANFPTNTGSLYIALDSPPPSATQASEGHFDNVFVTTP